MNLKGGLLTTSCRPRIFDVNGLWWRPIEPSWSRDVRKAVEDVDSDGVVAVNATRTVEFGIDQAHIGSKKSRHGSIKAIVEDLVDLGVNVVRQPGPTELLATYILIGRDSRGLPLAADIATSFIASTVADLEELLYQAGVNGLEIVFTVGTAGLGASATQRSADEKIRAATDFPWSRAHLGEWLHSNEFGYVFDGADAEPELDYLDTRDRYQWYWLTEYVREVCRQLIVCEENIRAKYAHLDFKLSDVVRAVAVGNELDGVNIVHSDVKNYAYGEDSWRRSSHNWAKVCYRMARAARDELPVGVAVWLPGLSSYDVDEDLLAESAAEDGEYAQNRIAYRFTWAWHIHWLREFLNKFSALAVDDGITTDDLWEIAESLDYHWYHRKKPSGRSMGPLHITRLVWELGQIRSVLDEAGFRRTKLTVFESGMSVLPADGTSNDYDFIPDGLTSVDDGGVSKYQLYQAFQVWRRLAGACAGGASVVGWHSFQSDHSGGDFYGCGLREDAERTNSSSAWRRWSWYCYQRFTQVFSAFESCSIVIPAAMPVNRYEKVGIVKIDTSSALDVVVFEFVNVSTEIHGWCSYAYLVLVDTWRSSQGAEVVGTAVGARQLNVIYVSTVPISATNEVGVESGNLPGGTATFKDDESRTGVSEITRRLNEKTYPLLVLSSGRFDWRVVEVYG